MARFLKKKPAPLAALYSSNLQGAHQTAQEFSKLLPLEIVLAADLHEGHLGKVQGLTKKEYHEPYGPLIDTLRNCEIQFTVRTYA